jgi:hypothetical protein
MEHMPKITTLVVMAPPASGSRPTARQGPIENGQMRVLANWLREAWQDGFFLSWVRATTAKPDQGRRERLNSL